MRIFKYAIITSYGRFDTSLPNSYRIHSLVYGESNSYTLTKNPWGEPMINTVPFDKLYLVYSYDDEDSLMKTVTLRLVDSYNLHVINTKEWLYIGSFLQQGELMTLFEQMTNESMGI
jgi:hypothetical protein